MITESLGYCCEWAFFCYHKKTAVIAARLGVTTRAVQKHKAATRECGQCEHRAKCLKELGALKGTRPLRK